MLCAALRADARVALRGSGTAEAVPFPFNHPLLAGVFAGCDFEAAVGELVVVAGGDDLGSGGGGEEFGVCEFDDVANSGGVTALGKLEILSGLFVGLGGEIDLLLRDRRVGVVSVDFAIDLLRGGFQIRFGGAPGLLRFAKKSAVEATGKQRLDQALTKTEVPDQRKFQILEVRETGEVQVRAEVGFCCNNVAFGGD